MKTLNIKTLLLALSAILFFMGCHTGKKSAEQNRSSKIVVAYVTSWSGVMPNPDFITHINYAFGHVNNSFDGLRINNESRLREIVALKKQAPNLKIMLSVGGWGSGRFSEMAADEKLRKSFAADCQRVVKEFDLDGIDIDWEYPTSSAANISASPDDTDNYTLLMRDIREAIGKDKLLTQATAANASYIDFKAIDKYIDFTNIMAYDMARPPKHHSPLYRSDIAGGITCEEAVKAHIAAGVPPNKLTLGMPFYGRASKGLSDFIDYKEIEKLSEFTEKWDEQAKAPYLVNQDGDFACGFDNPRSLAIKCQFIIDNGLLGGMYWDYSGDNQSGDLSKIVFNTLCKIQ